MTVRQIQCLLTFLGYGVTIDGIDGPETQTALKRFAADYGCGTDGLQRAVAEWKQKSDFWAEIRHFRKEEFRCKCGGRYCNGWPAEPQEQMVRMADAIREHFGRPAAVISGLRCERWNALQGGVANSQHRFGEACDITVEGIGWEQVLSFVKTLPGLRYAYHIEGSNNVHFDIPAGKR